MTPENFCYWLQGWYELNQTIDHRDGATPETMEMINDHLKLVFTKETPDRKIVFEKLKENLKKNNEWPYNTKKIDPINPLEGMKVIC